MFSTRKILGGTAAILVGGELVLRACGLANPALSIVHPTIEYMFAPNQNLLFFAHRFQTNAWGMRSPDIPAHKADRSEFRVLALGDSVLNGGNPTDQSELATTLLSLDHTLVMNASAGSWGPPNLLAYVREFGLFDADAIVIVLSSHDAFDVPTFAPLDPFSHPSSRPISALWTFATRYVWPRLPSLSMRAAAPAASEFDGRPPPSDAMPSFRELLRIASTRGRPCVILNATVHEARLGRKDPGYAEIADATRSENGVVVELQQFVNTASYRDDIHLSAEGQVHLAQAMKSCLAQTVTSTK
jgi:hypothetical protein